jgi:hypothetical protein
MGATERLAVRPASMSSTCPSSLAWTRPALRVVVVLVHMRSARVRVQARAAGDCSLLGRVPKLRALEPGGFGHGHE